MTRPDAVVLHLSDLHFGSEFSRTDAGTALAQRRNTLDGLIDVIARLDRSSRPQVIVISGDLGWAGRPADYEEAGAWVRRLLAAASLSANELIMCPGNHDVDRGEAEYLVRPDDARHADRLLSVERMSKLGTPFHSYVEFCQQLGVPPYRVASQNSYLAGLRTVAGIRFVSLNSAWFCRGNDDKDRLYIGFPQLEAMIAADQLGTREDYNSGPLTVGVLHHPSGWLNDAETNAYDGRPAAYQVLARRSHLLLSGHTHGAVGDPQRIGTGGWLFVGGAGYSGVRDFNNFSLLELKADQRVVTRRPYEFDPRDQEWVLRPERRYSLHSTERDTMEPGRGPPEVSPSARATLRARARDHATRYVAAKSRAATISGALPAITERLVGIHDASERVPRAHGVIAPRTEQHFAPLIEAIESERPVFLFGSLGSGKSTLAGKLVSEINQGDSDLIAMLVPAGHFLGRAPRSVAALLDSLSSYLAAEIAPETGGLKLGDMLASGEEVTLVLDGFDELRLAEAEALLTQAQEATALYERLRVVATGRPIELRGLDYARWALLETLPLTREEQLAILSAEARADGLDNAAANDDAALRMRALRQTPELLRLAETPLVLRLLRPHLHAGLTDRTLGDLLLDVLRHRLSEWGIREGKEHARAAFAAALPDGPAREALLSRVAVVVHNAAGRTISSDQLLEVVASALGDQPGAANVVAEAVAFLRTTFLDGPDRALTFPSQPLFQCAVGLHIAHAIRRGEDPNVNGPLQAIWREVSFAAAAIRRKGLSEQARPYLREYVSRIFAEAGRAAPPVCAAVVAESLDPELATLYLSQLRVLGSHPLSHVGEGVGASAGDYARCFTLAGDEAFDWFYDQYLDPRFPNSGYLENIGDATLQRWLVLKRFEVTDSQKGQLGALIRPHLGAASMRCHTTLPSVAIILPEAFEVGMRARMLVDALSQPMLREPAEQGLRVMLAGGEAEAVRSGLLAQFHKTADGSGGEAYPSLTLWTEFFGAEPPPVAVVRVAIKDLATTGTEHDHAGLRVLQGIDPVPMLRWYALSGSTASAESSLALYNQGERSFALLAAGLLAGASKYPHNEAAERALDTLLSEEGEHGLEWIATQLARKNGVSGPAPAMWRLVLRGLSRIPSPRPDILRFCLPYLGEYTLPRNPDVRRAFQTLLRTESVYRETLRDALGSVNRTLRGAAACVLLTCDPESEVRAAEGVVRGTVDTLHRSEWYRFALRLRLGTTVLRRLEELIQDLPATSRAFALAMLHHNGVNLTDEQHAMLVEGLLGGARWLDSPDYSEAREARTLHSVLSSPRSFAQLLAVLDSEAGERAERAAVALLHHHLNRLDVAHEARAWVHAYREVTEIVVLWNRSMLRERLADHEFRAAFFDSALALQSATQVQSAVALFARAYTEPEVWRELLWLVLTHSRASSNDEITVQWLLEQGKADPHIGKVIGAAARDYLSAQRMATTQPARGALALLAHEFGGLSDDDLADTIPLTMTSEIESALIARVGPARDVSYGSRRATYLLEFAPVPAPSAPLTTEDVFERTRDTQDPQEDPLSFLERVICDGGLTESATTALGEHSRLGALSAALLEVCRGGMPKPQWLVRALSVPAAVTKPGQLPQVVRLREAVKAVCLEDNEYRNAYLAQLQADLERDIMPRRIALESPEELFRELLRHTGALGLGHLARLLEEVLARPYILDSELSNSLAVAILQTKEGDRGAIAEVLRNAGESIMMGVSPYGHGRESAALLLIGLGLLHLEDSVSDTAESTVLAGLPGIMLAPIGPVDGDPRDGTRLSGGDVLNPLIPLLDAIDSGRLKRCIDAGLRSREPDVRGCCRFLAALAGVSFPLQPDPA